MDEIAKVNLESEDLVTDRIEQLKNLFPEAITEGDGTVDFEKLRLLLGDQVEDGDERYSFVWPGKANAIRQSQSVTTATLIPKPDESIKWDTTENLYIEGDNLIVLKLLQRGYHGKIRLIYIDPPYNTGSDFVYRDSFEDSVENYKLQAGLAGQSNPDTSGRYHSDWCSMIYPRIKLARELLAPDGCFCVQIDGNEYCNMKKICDEIFGANCFMTTIVVKMSEPTGMKMAHADTRIPKLKEYILVYFKEEHPRLGEVRIPKERWDNEYKTFLEGVTHTFIGLSRDNNSPAPG